MDSRTQIGLNEVVFFSMKFNEKIKMSNPPKTKKLQKG